MRSITSFNNQRIGYTNPDAADNREFTSADEVFAKYICDLKDLTNRDYLLLGSKFLIIIRNILISVRRIPTQQRSILKTEMPTLYQNCVMILLWYL
jgi:hypothetical protein